MDGTIREIQRAAAAGDAEAQARLDGILARIGRQALTYTGPDAPQDRAKGPRIRGQEALTRFIPYGNNRKGYGRRVRHRFRRRAERAEIEEELWELEG